MIAHQKLGQSELLYKSKLPTEKMVMNRHFQANWVSQPMGCLFIKCRSVIHSVEHYSENCICTVVLNTRSSTTTEVAHVVPINHLLPKTKLPLLHFCHWQYGSSVSEFDTVGSKSCHIVWNNT